MTTMPSQNSEGHQVWNPSVGVYFQPASNKRESYSGVVGALNDQLNAQGAVNKAYPHNFAGIISAIEDLVFTQKEVPVVPNVKPPGGDVGTDIDGNPEWNVATQPRDGELWYDTRQGRMFIAIEGDYYQTNGADGLAEVTTDSTEPQTPVVGQFWWDASTSSLYIFDGFWRDTDGNIEDSKEPGSTPVWRLITSTGSAFGAGAVSIPTGSLVRRALTGSTLPALDYVNLNTQNEFNEWVYDALEAVETALDADEGGNARLEAGTTAPSAPDTGNLWYDTTSSELKVYDGTAWVLANTPLNYDGDVSTLTAAINSEQTNRQAAITALSQQVATAVTASSAFQNLDTSVSDLQTQVNAIPVVDSSLLTTLTASDALTTRVTALEAAAPDYSLVKSKAEAATEHAALTALINALPTTADLSAVSSSIPSITGLATQSYVTSAINNITTEYLPKTGGTLSGAFIVQKQDMSNPAFDFSTEKWYGYNTHKYRTNSDVANFSTFGTNEKPFEYAWNFGSNEDFCWKHGTNGKVFSISKTGATAKDVVLADFGENTQSGLALQNQISLRAKITEYDSELSTVRADISSLQNSPQFNSKKVLYGDTAPTVALSDGDLWFDSRNLRLNVQHGGYWVFPDRVEDLTLKAALFNAVNTSADFETLKIKLLAVLV